MRVYLADTGSQGVPLLFGPTCGENPDLAKADVRMQVGTAGASVTVARDSGDPVFARLWPPCLLGWDQIPAPPAAPSAAGRSRDWVPSQEAGWPPSGKN